MRSQRNPFVNAVPALIYMPGEVLVPLCGRNKDLVARVSPEDAHLVCDRRWYISHGYAVSVSHRAGNTRNCPDRNVNIAMHRLIMGEPPEPGLTVDHEFGNRLDNRRNRLRWLSPEQQNQNLAAHRPGYISRSNPHGYRGVRQERGSSTWAVRVESKHYGAYPTAYLAAQVYDHVTRIIRPLQTGLNLPDDPLPSDFLVPGLNVEKRVAALRSEVSGVSWFKPQQKWRVVVRKKHLGYFNTQAEAEAYRLTHGDNHAHRIS